MSRRFQDSGEALYHFEEYRIIECPKCSKPTDFENLRVSCTQCGYNKEFEETGHWYGLVPLTVPIVDYLKIPCCGETLWVVNLEHLNFLEEYTQAQLRERTPNINKSLISRLPQWMKSAKNRDAILTSIRKLKTRLDKNGYKRRKKVA